MGPEHFAGQPMRTLISNPLSPGRLTAETMWLAALILAPLLFVPASSRPFEFYNVVWVRVVVISVGSLLLIGRALRSGGREQRIPAVEGGRRRGWFGMARHWVRTDPLSVALVVLSAAQVVSALLSVAPSLSLFGSSQRNQGLLSATAYLLLFWVVTTHLTDTSQRRRAIFVLSMTGLVVALYAIQQGHGLDPVSLSPSWESSRVSSTLGNPVFLGAFLILLIPIVLGQLLRSAALLMDEGSRRRVLLPLALMAGFCVVLWSWLAGPTALTPDMPGSVRFYVAAAVGMGLLALTWIAWQQGRAGWRLPSAGGHTVVLSVLVSALIMTKSRGPVLGLAAALLTMALLHAAVARKRWLALSVLVAGGMVGAGLLGMGMLNRAGTSSVCLHPTVGRLVCPLSERPEGAEARPFIWRGALALILPHEPLGAGTAAADGWHQVRPWLGYGQETLLSIFPRFAPAGLNAVITVGVGVDRAHNGVLDTLIETGLVGLLAMAALAGIILHRSLTWLGIVRTRRETIRLFGWMGLCGALAAGLLAAGLDIVYAPLGMVAGGLFGWWGYLMAEAVRPPGVDQEGTGPGAHWMVVAMLAGLTGHLVEQQFSFATTSIQVVGWFLLAVLVATVRRRPNGKTVGDAAPGIALAGGIGDGVAHGVLTGLILLLPAHAFLQAAAMEAGTTDPAALLRYALLQQPGPGGVHFAPVVGLGFAATVVIGLTLFHHGRSLRGGPADRRGGPLAFAAAAALAFTVGSLLLAMALPAVGASPELELSWLEGGEVLLSIGLLAVIVFLLVVRRHAGVQGRRLFRLLVAVALGAGAVLAAGVNLEMLQTDLLARQASAEDNPARRLELARQAANRQPERSAAAYYLGQVYAGASLEADDPAVRRSYARSAEAAWQDSQANSPYDPVLEASLAELERRLSQEANAVDRQVHLEAAIDHDQAALGLSPNAAHLWTWLGLDLLARAELQVNVSTEVSNDRRLASAAIGRAAELDPGSCFVRAGQALVEPAWRDTSRLALSALHRADCRSSADQLTAAAQETALRALVQSRRLALVAGEEAKLADWVRQSDDPDRTLSVVMAMARRFLAEDRPEQAAQLVEFAHWVWPGTVEAQYGDLLREASGGMD
jgi:O-antigen ligase